MGVIAVETRQVEQRVPADPANPASAEAVLEELSGDGHCVVQCDVADAAQVHKNIGFLYWNRLARHPEASGAFTRAVEAARRLAERIMLEGGDSPEDRIAYAYLLATAHRPPAGRHSRG